MARENSNTQNQYRYIYRKQVANLSDREKVLLCLEFYRTYGIVKNVIDLMSDFISEGVRFVHPDSVKQEFWEIWSTSIKLQNRTERYANTLLKAGFIVIRPVTGTLTVGEPYVKGAPQQIKKVPVQYIFVNPAQIYLYGNEQFGETLACYVVPKVTSAQGAPADIQNLLKLKVVPNLTDKDGTNLILLDQKTTWVDTYKKDDWQTYADPLIFAAIPDLQFYEKMREMDISAMDGVINVIRLFKMGETLSNGSIARPSPASVDKLDNMLKQAAGGGTADIIWDHMIKMETEYPPIEKILGKAKYEQVRDDILAAFGIPEILINGKGPGSFSNQYLGMKAFVEKLEYVREKIQYWLRHEVSTISEKMGWDDLPIIKFTNINLRDDSSLQKLVKEMLDRRIISKKTSLSYLDEDWEIERGQIASEMKEEDKNEDLKSFGPFINAELTAKPTSSSGFSAPNNGKPNGKTGPQSALKNSKPKGS